MLRKYIEPHHTISIIGTAKNAGKTTVLNQIILEYKEEILAITSIGLDGEKLDTVTNLPKPQIHVYKNTIIATAYDCIQSDMIVYEKTNIATPLGEIVIAEVTKDQDVLIAGPSTKNDLLDVVQRLQKYNPKKILIDGALFRKSLASSSIADAVILSTGASYSHDIEKVVFETIDIVKQFQIEEVNQMIKKRLPEGNCVIHKDDTISMIENDWIHTNTDILQDILSKESKYLYLHGALTDNIIKALIAMRDQLDHLTLILNDATHILCSNTYYNKLPKMNVTVKVRHKSKLLIVSYNPTSPYGYTFDNQKFKKLLEDHIDIPCINVLEDRK